MNLNNTDLKYSIDDETLEILCAIDRVTDSQYFVIGASARDMIFYNIYGLELSERATGDIDFAVCVQNWQDYDEIRSQLKKTHNFKDDESQRQRLIAPSGVPIDFIPFGSISEDDRSIQWPDTDLTMSIMGFKDAQKTCYTINFQNYSINIISIELFTVLKFVAWADRNDRIKDLKDIKYIIEQYIKIPQVRLQVKEFELTKVLSDLNHISAAILAINIKNKVSAETHCVLYDIISSGTDHSSANPLTKKFKKVTHGSYNTAQGLLSVFQKYLGMSS